MSSQPIIHIPEPCHENWDAMIPSERGRFCNACSKVVVDFTSMDVEATLGYLREHAGSRVCGRFNHQQLAAPVSTKPESKLPYQKYFISPFHRMAAMIITGFTFMLTSCRPFTTGEPEWIPNGKDSSITKDTNSNVIDTPIDTIIKIPQPKPVEITKEIPEVPVKGKIEVEYHTTGLISIEYQDTLTPDTTHQ